MEPTDSRINDDANGAAEGQWRPVTAWQLWCHPQIWARQIAVERHCAEMSVAEISVLNQKIAQTNLLMTEKEKLLAESEERVARLQEECDRQRTEIERLEASLKEAQAVNESLQADLGMVDNIVDKATQMRDRYERRIALLRAKVVELREALRITDTSNPDDELAVIDMYEQSVRHDDPDTPEDKKEPEDSVRTESSDDDNWLEWLP